MKVAAAAETWTRSRLGHDDDHNTKPVDYRRELILAAVGGDKAAALRCDLLYQDWRTSAIALEGKDHA